MNLASSGKELRVVHNQKGAPTYTKDLAYGLKQLIERSSRVNGFKIYHLANSGETTWFEAAKKLLEKMHSKIPIKSITAAELNRPAKRPENSILDLSKIKKEQGIELRRWDDALNDYWSEVLEKEWQTVAASR